MAGGVMPLGKIVYLCDDLLEDSGSGKLHVLGAFDAVHPPEGETYPFRLDHLCVFAQFAGGLGPTPVEVRVIDASTGNQVLGSPTYQVNFPGGQLIVTVLIRMLDCPIPHAGTYLVQLHCQGAFVDDRRLLAQ